MAAKYRARDFILFLPAWVRSEVLIGREYIRLPHCKLRCFPWNPYGGAPRSRLAFKAWVTIVNLPYECWYEARVAAIVSCFGRYLMADDATANMRDLTGFRCQIAVDTPADIPESLAISLGEIIVTVNVRLESTSPFGGDDHGTPFLGGDRREGGGQTDPLGSSLARRIPVPCGNDAGSDSRAGAEIGPDESWDSSEIHDRRRPSGRDSGDPRPRGGAPQRSVAPYCPQGAPGHRAPTSPCRSGIALGGTSVSPFKGGPYFWKLFELFCHHACSGWLACFGLWPQLFCCGRRRGLRGS